MSAAEVIKSLSFGKMLIIAVIVIIVLFMIWVVVLKKSDFEGLSSPIPYVGSWANSAQRLMRG